jgi:hypothetical protein
MKWVRIQDRLINVGKIDFFACENKEEKFYIFAALNLDDCHCFTYLDEETRDSDFEDLCDALEDYR